MNNVLYKKNGTSADKLCFSLVPTRSNGHPQDIDKVTNSAMQDLNSFTNLQTWIEGENCIRKLNLQNSESLRFLLELQDGLFPSDKTGVHGSLYRESTFTAGSPPSPFLIVPPNWRSCSLPEDLNCKGMSSAWPGRARSLNPPSMPRICQSE